MFVFARRFLFESRTNVFLSGKAEIAVETRQVFSPQWNPPHWLAFFGNDSCDQAKPLYKAAAGVNDPGCTPKRSNA